ncbi:MAG: hypothetical protein J0I73_15380 [Sphingomonas sp.]|uniref:hypothetical protein n=2 Tax=unclassified Sphingomonas TaxID=196159 RepID=UPI001AD1D0F0|nr:hypothetical protein [Sphingomonas sp.]MBN8849456.1 hypothetical protein [Sphingomonas sp.]
MMPIFVETDEALLMFPSIKMAERCLDAEDVRHGVYARAFGSSGEKFAIEADGRRVIITPIAHAVDVSGLRELLKRFLEAVGEPASDDASLKELVATAEAYWEERDPLGDRFSQPVPWWGCLWFVAALAGAVTFVWKLAHCS